MKFLDAKRKTPDAGENKMMPGTRPGQRERPRTGMSDPQLLHGSRLTSEPRTLKDERDHPQPRMEIRELAEKLQVDLSTIKGSGKDGEILVKDVRAAAQKPKVSSQEPPASDTKE